LSALCKSSDFRSILFKNQTGHCSFYRIYQIICSAIPVPEYGVFTPIPHGEKSPKKSPEKSPLFRSFLFSIPHEKLRFKSPVKSPVLSFFRIKRGFSIKLTFLNCSHVKLIIADYILKRKGGNFANNRSYLLGPYHPQLTSRPKVISAQMCHQLVRCSGILIYNGFIWLCLMLL
jgi:hypothetical protein